MIILAYIDAIYQLGALCNADIIHSSMRLPLSQEISETIYQMELNGCHSLEYRVKVYIGHVNLQQSNVRCNGAIKGLSYLSTDNVYIVMTNRNTILMPGVMLQLLTLVYILFIEP